MKNRNPLFLEKRNAGHPFQIRVFFHQQVKNNSKQEQGEMPKKRKLKAASRAKKKSKVEKSPARDLADIVTVFFSTFCENAR